MTERCPADCLIGNLPWRVIVSDDLPPGVASVDLPDCRAIVVTSEALDAVVALHLAGRRAAA